MIDETKELAAQASLNSKTSDTNPAQKHLVVSNYVLRDGLDIIISEPELKDEPYALQKFVAEQTFRNTYIDMMRAGFTSAIEANNGIADDTLYDAVVNVYGVLHDQLFAQLERNPHNKDLYLPRLELLDDYSLRAEHLVNYFLYKINE